MEEKKWKVYKHTTPSGKVYIGITSTSVQKRWNNGNGYKKCKAFYRAIQKYGWDNITHEILFDNLTKDEACKKEIELIKEYDSQNRTKGYNISSGGGVIDGFEFIPWNKGLTKESDHRVARGFISQETRDKLRKANLGKHHSPETIEKLRKANTGKIISNETRKKISEKMKNSAYYKGKCLSNECRQASYLANIKTTYKYDLEGNYVEEFDSHISAARSIEPNADKKRINTMCTLISDCCLGNIRSAYGFYWTHEKYENFIPQDNQKKSIYQYDKSNNLINIFESLSEASRNTGINLTCICECCKGRQKTAGGYIWKYAEEANSEATII